MYICTIVMFVCFSVIFTGPGVAEADENCVKFLERTMTCSFDKVIQRSYIHVLY